MESRERYTKQIPKKIKESTSQQKERKEVRDRKTGRQKTHETKKEGKTNRNKEGRKKKNGRRKLRER